MEEIKIKQFLAPNSGYDYGDGDGDGDGDGRGSGDGSGRGPGSGDGFGYGYGDGRSSGSGDGVGRGYGDGCGIGNGDGDTYGCGNGYGYGEGIKAIGKHLIYIVDGIYTIFYSIHKNVAKGAIFYSDFTLSPCYVVKGNGKFAHGKTIKQAMGDLERKIFEDLDVEERIEIFVKEFKLDKKYPAMKFFEWHNKLTGSCEMGRKSFAKNHDIDLNKDEFTVEEFIELTKNDFGREVIKQLAERLGL